MAELRHADVQWLLRKVPPRVRAVAESRRFPVIIAGGFIRSVIAGEAVNDIDLFTSSETWALDLAMALRDNVGAIETLNAYTIRTTTPVTQIIRRWLFDTVQECIESFDFTIARAGIEFRGGKWQSYCDDDFYSDLAAKRLRYRAPDRREDEAGSMLRMLKFYGRGYRAPLHDIAAVVARSVKGIEHTATTIGFVKSEAQVTDFVLTRLRVVDPAADPEEEGHLG